MPRQGSTATLSPIDSPQASRRRGSGSRRRLEVTPLSTIPQVYFEENFHLENPRTFDVVSEKSEVIRTPITTPVDEIRGANGFMNGSAAAQPRKALATNAILQEKLSWYLDTVEIHLISSISAASTSFFAALGSLKELHSEAADSVTKIKKLREDLAKLDKDMAVGGLEIVGMKERRDNLRKLKDSVDQLRSVVSGAAHCEELVDQGDLETALDRIVTLEDYTCGRFRPKASEDASWLTSQPRLQLRDLRRLRALDGFAEGTDQLRARVGKAYEVRFMDALLADLRHHVTSVPNQDTLKRWANASLRARGHSAGPSVVPTYLQTNSQLRQNLSAVLHGLSRSKSLTIASAAFREAIMREMKSLVRQHLPSSSDDDTESIASVSTTMSRARTQQDKSARLARNLRALGPDDAEELLMKMYCGVGEALRRLQTQVKMLLDVTSAQVLSPISTGPRSPQKSPNIGSIDALAPPAIKGRARSNSTPLQEELMQALDMSSLLGQAVDAAQTQVTKILKVRAEQSTSLGLTHFLRYFSLNRLFADECEAISGRSGASLKSAVNTHIVEFIANMARNEREQLERTMDNDQWAAKDFSDADGVVLKQVLEGMSSDPQPWLSQAYVWQDNARPRLNGTITAPTATNGTGKETARSAYIDDEKFVLVNSAITLLHGLSRFQTLISCIPSIATDVSRDLNEYLRFFNSRACQLVLGAGATRSTAALPNINTKHLALALQALSFVIALIPYVREFMRRRPGMTSEKLIEFDKTKRLYQDHQVSINEKLVDIMSGRATRHVKTMQDIDFDDNGGSGGAVSKHMETLAKDTAVLHKTLGRYLPEMHVRGIMAPVFMNYRDLWGDAFKVVRVGTEGGRQRYVEVLVCADVWMVLIMDRIRLLRDAEHFEAKLGKIDGVGDTASYLLDIAREKSVAVAPVPQAPQTMPREEVENGTKDERPVNTNKEEEQGNGG
jgi:vacuolar protein sorting-associated protein 54